jgi:hypothetical protein
VPDTSASTMRATTRLTVRAHRSETRAKNAAVCRVGSTAALAKAVGFRILSTLGQTSFAPEPFAAPHGLSLLFFFLS